VSSDATAPQIQPPRPGFQDALQRLFFADEEFARKYEGWEEIGRGGFACVVKTFCRDYGHPIAVKVFAQLDEEQLARFRQEVHNSRLFHSRNVVKTFGATIRGTLAWIEMEYVDGPNLRKELERRQAEGQPFTVEQAVAIGTAVSEALAAGHAADVLHRDVKPANILLPRSGEVVAKLGDFGVSRFSGHAKVTKTGCSPGTPQFWSPEVCDGRPSAAPSDVYSFSVCLYMLLSGNHYPYSIPEEAVVSTYQEAHRRQAPIPITVFNPNVPQPLQEILTLGMAKEPEHRPSIREVHEALRSATSPALPGHQSAPKREKPRRRLAQVGALAAAGAVAVASALYVLAGGVLTRDNRSTLEEPSMPSAAPATASDSAGGSHIASAQEGRALGFVAAFEGPAVALTNRSQSTVGLKHLILVPEGQGESTLAIDAPLAPDETLLLPLDEFSPKPVIGTGGTLKVVTDAGAPLLLKLTHP
jgi:serine/threonine protein kinase